MSEEAKPSKKKLNYTTVLISTYHYEEKKTMNWTRQTKMTQIFLPKSNSTCYSKLQLLQNVIYVTLLTELQKKGAKQNLDWVLICNTHSKTFLATMVMVQLWSLVYIIKRKKLMYIMFKLKWRQVSSSLVIICDITRTSTLNHTTTFHITF